ncbi:MAG: hypothetical protein RL459_1332 [Pseudomonadota bacterium]|jgi:uncharacterized membrane protein
MDGLDAIRGIAMVWMTVFHASFDLNQFGYLHQNFYADPFWTWQRTTIVSLFLLCAGAGQAIAVAQGQSWPRFWRRWAQIALCACLVTAASWWMYPKSYIYFGVLHGMALMLIVVRLTAAWGAWLWLAGALAVTAAQLAPVLHQHWPALQLLNGQAYNWLGLISQKPITEDYVPLLPWLGVMWWGAAMAPVALRHYPSYVRTGQHWPLQTQLARLGRWSLSYYMLHQPVLIGGLMVWRSAMP